jgi:hypothetical protein
MDTHDPREDGIEPYRPRSTPEVNLPRRVEEPATDLGGERLTTYFGMEVRERRRLSWFAIILAILAVGVLGVSGAAGSLAVFLSAGVGLLVFAIALALSRPPAMTVSFSEKGITFEPSGFFLPYHEIVEVFAPTRFSGRNFRILLLCHGGHVVLPAELDTDSEALYEFLNSQPMTRPALPDDLDPLFHAFLRQQSSVHGAKEIVVYRRPAWTAQGRIHRSWRHSNAFRAGFAFFVMGIAWLVGYALFRRDALFFLLPTGIGAAALGVIIFIAGAIQRAQSSGPRKLHNATLVVSPSALALLQGDLKGELRWREIVKLTLQKNALFTGSGTVGHGLLIQVQGASILVLDIFHWPIEHVEWLLRKHSGM